MTFRGFEKIKPPGSSMSGNGKSTSCTVEDVFLLQSLPSLALVLCGRSIEGDHR